MVQAFPGLTPYLRDAARDFPRLHGGHVGRALALDAVKRVADALAQATLAAPEQALAVAAEADTWRDVLALALAGVESAIADVQSVLAPEPAPEKPAPKHESPRKK